MGDFPNNSLSPHPILSSLPSFPPATTSTLGGVQDPGQAKLWKTIGGQYRRVPNGGENPAQASPFLFAPHASRICFASSAVTSCYNNSRFLQNLAHLQPGHHASGTNHAAVFASNSQPQPNLAQTNPAAEQQEFGEDRAQKHIIQGLDRSAQPSNLQHLGSMLELPTPQVLALTHKLDSLPVRDLEVRVSAWRENMPSLEARVRELLEAALSPGATAEIGAAYGRAKDELEQNQFLVAKAQEILTRRHIQTNEAIQAQAQANAQAAAPLTSTLDKPAQQLQQQAPSQRGMHHHNHQGQAQAAQDQQSTQQQHIIGHRSSGGGGTLPPNAQAHGFRCTGGSNPRYTPEVTVRAREIVMNMAREIEQTCQYHQREVSEIQRAEMGQVIVAAYPFAAEFGRLASLHYVFLNDEQQTRSLLVQAALLCEQHQIVESGQQRYIMTPVEVGAVQNSLWMAIHQIEKTYTQKLRQHHEQMAELRGAEAGGPEMDLGASAGLGGQLPQLVQQRELSKLQYGSHESNPGKSSMGTVSQQQPEATPGTLDSPPGTTLSPAEEPATPQLPKGKSKVPITPKKRPPAPHKEYTSIELPPQALEFNVFSKRQREDDVPPAAEPVLPTTGPLSSKRVRTGFHNGDPLESTDEALSKPQDVAPGPKGDGIDPDILAQLGGILDDTAPDLSGLVLPVPDQSPDALSGCPKVEDVFDFLHCLDGTASGDDPLGGSGAPKADRPNLKEDMAEGTMRGIGVSDSVSDAQPNVDTQPGQISCEEIFQRLVKHGCVDLSSRMDPEQYSSGLIIGGAFGDIWKGRLRDGTEVAIKVWRFSSLLHNGRKFVKRAMREIYYWSKAKHEYVQELMGVIMFQGRLGMVSRWMEHGNMREYICKNPSVDRYVLCMQVATGIAYLHSQAMVHGDLKGLNVLVSCDGVARLSDFDHSIMLGCSLAFSDTSKLGGGTTRWMAPELILEDNCSRGTYTDVYSLGMTMLEIITGTPPYYPQLLEDVQVIRAIMKKKLPTRPMDHLGDNVRGNRMWGLLLSCWNYDPVARPKAIEVVESLRNIMNLPASSPV